jgi:hypothetical protein
VNRTTIDSVGQVRVIETPVRTIPDSAQTQPDNAKTLTAVTR